MYQVSNAFIEAMKSPVQEHRLTGTIGSISFSEANVVDGSFSISNQSTDTSDVVLGSCYVGQLTAEFVGINIAYGKWINKTITLSFGLKVGEYYEYVPMGVYKVKEAKHTDHGVQVTAYDNMIKFDKKFRKSHYMNLSGMTNIIDQLCLDAGVVCGMSHAQIEALPNGDRTGINIYGSTGKKAEFANDITTLRDLLFWVAQTLGCFATMNRAGQLEFRPYTQTVVDQITEQHRIAGATFADYVTHYIGIYVENLDDNTEDYYGYDATALQQELTETMGEITQDQEDITDLEADRAEWAQKLANHECTQEEYDAAIAEIDAQEKALTKDINQLSKRVEWLSNAIAQSADDGSDMVFGANPLTMAKNKTTRDQQRREILGALADISYTPFSASVVCGCIYDLGDVIQFSGGLYNSSTDSFGCVMSYTYTHNGGTELEGYGVDPSIPMVRNKTQKSVDRAQKNATTALNENDMVFDFGDGNEVVATNKKAYESAGSMTRKMQFWEHNFNFPAGQDWAKYNTSVTAPYPFVICTYPDLDHGNPRYYNLNGKVMQSFVVVLVFKLSDEEIQKVGNQFMLTNQSWQAYAGNLNHGYNNFGSYVYRDTIYYSKYYYCGTGTGTLMYGLIGEVEPDYKFNSWNDMMYAMNNGTINIPGVTPDDECVLPTESTAVQAAANAEYFAEKLAGNNPTRTSEPYIGNVNLMSEKTMQRLSDAFYQMGEAADNIGAVSDVKVDNVSVVTDKVANINSMTGATAQAAGTKGLVPAPASGDNEKFLRGDGTWQTVQGGGSAEMLAPTPFIYSEDEEQVGIWIDGKPLYAKTFKPTSPTTTNIAQVVQDISSLNIDVPVNLFGNILNVPINWTLDSSNGVSCFVTSAKTGIAMKVINSLLTNITCNITIQYTKTTDTAWQGGFKAYGFTPVIYSETEREIGVWSDGKPLYQKTLTPTTSSSPNTMVVIVDLGSDAKIHDFWGTVNETRLINSYVDDNSWSATWIAGNGYQIGNIVKGDIYLNKPAFITVIYTKESDTAGSGKYTTLGTPAVHYSTDEQVIGTWIDGRTVYQKTFKITSNVAFTVNTWVSTEIDKGNMDLIIDGRLQMSYQNSPSLHNLQFGWINNKLVGNSYRTFSVAANNGYIILQYTKTS